MTPRASSPTKSAVETEREEDARSAKRDGGGEQPPFREGSQFRRSSSKKRGPRPIERRGASGGGRASSRRWGEGRRRHAESRTGRADAVRGFLRSLDAPRAPPALVAGVRRPDQLLRTHGNSARVARHPRSQARLVWAHFAHDALRVERSLRNALAEHALHSRHGGLWIHGEHARGVRAGLRGRRGRHAHLQRHLRLSPSLRPVCSLPPPPSAGRRRTVRCDGAAIRSLCEGDSHSRSHG